MKINSKDLMTNNIMNIVENLAQMNHIKTKKIKNIIIPLLLKRLTLKKIIQICLLFIIKPNQMFIELKIIKKKDLILKEMNHHRQKNIVSNPFWIKKIKMIFQQVLIREQISKTNN